MKPPKVCAEPACPNDAVTDGRCTAHRRKPWAAKVERDRKGWNQARRKVLRRDAGLCVLCQMPAAEVDHLVPVAWGGTDDLSNLNAMCDSCHGDKSTEERALGAKLRACSEADRAEMIQRHVYRWSPP